jgi:hypothetical protein
LSLYGTGRLRRANIIVIDSVSLPSASYASPGPAPAESAAPQPADANPPSPPSVSTLQPLGGSTLPPPGTSPNAPTVSPDFTSAVAGRVVLDYRDPATHQVILQVPMRSALSQIAGAASVSATVGTHVDTKA